MSSVKCLSSVTIMSSPPAHGTTCSDQWLKLTPYSKSNFSQSISPNSPSQSQSHTRENNNNTTMKTNDDCKMKSEKAEDTGGGGGWSFLQCLTNNKEEAADCNEKVYVHPLVKRSSSMVLSEKSLEMCTESLGSETGSLVSESSDDDDIINGINNYTSTTLVRESNNLVKKRTKRGPSFPPPLTSISSSNSVIKVRPHREGGRLVLQAVTVSSSSPPTYFFRTERSDGRLRLCLVKDLVDCVPNEEDQDEAEEEEEEEELAKGVNEDEDEDYCCDYGEDEEGESENDRGENGIENLPRPSIRCNAGGREDGNRLIWDWESFLVAT